MTKRSRSFLFFLATGMTLATVACGGGSSSVTSPEPPAAGVPPRGGASIVGTVQSGSAAAGQVGASSASGLRVSVTGTSLQAVTDDAGRFTLQSVPSGRVELRFQGSGIDARLAVDGLQDGRTLTVTVRVSGSSATLVDDDDDDEGEVEFEGKVDSVGTSSLVVGGRMVHVNDLTRLLDEKGMPIPLSAFQPGDIVEVEGTAQSDGSVLAEKVKLEDDDDDDDDHDGDDDEDDDHEAEFKGTISSLNPLVIGGRTVTTDGSTKYFGHRHEVLPSSEVLKLGNRVEVEGIKQPDNSVLARKIQLEDED